MSPGVLSREHRMFWKAALGAGAADSSSQAGRWSCHPVPGDSQAVCQSSSPATRLTHPAARRLNHLLLSCGKLQFVTKMSLKG